jgi:hypothetical protein
MPIFKPLHKPKKFRFTRLNCALDPARTRLQNSEITNMKDGRRMFSCAVASQNCRLCFVLKD